MIDKDGYIEKLLQEYSKSFDITRDYEIGGVKARAYGYFSTISEKYVISPKANLWSIHGFEHILFLDKETVTLSDLDEARSLMEEHMAPELVCKGNKYPEKDHMYSYLTIAYICDKTPDQETLNALKKFKYEKNYLMTIRGHVEAHMVLMDLSTGKAYANRVAKHLSDFYMKVRG
ncbi:hypothetical protein SAMN06297422_11837 [Lachnospiraceae bacterium]|nr:hypothetical protein SAMN06297422_11837 [Lachnospiraceae bacterium]